MRIGRQHRRPALHTQPCPHEASVRRVHRCLEGDEQISCSVQTTIGGRHHTPAWHSARTVTAVCTNLAIIMERTDEQILPAVYNFIGRTFDATPSQLGALTLSRALMQAVTSPIGGVLGEC